MTSFQKMGLSEDVLKAIDELGFDKPSEIQSKAIPYLLTEYIDFIGLAQTGTGKTAAFGIPLVERIDPENEQTQALILAPTRELCQQIAQQLKLFGKYHEGINMLAVYGGSPISTQIKALKNNTQHIIIATPGRLIDLINKKRVDLSGIHAVVLDEADEMLNMGFKEEIDEILSFSPEDKMTWLFSATMADDIKTIVRTYMESPYEVHIKNKTRVNANIEHQFICVKHSNKTEALKRIIDVHDNMRAVVFCKTKRDTQSLAEVLLKQGYKTDALHGDLSQELRDRVMKRFKNESIQILIATDVAARGIDVNDLTHVIHYALPDDNAYYTHRSGRTARAGKKGISIAFINGKERWKLKRLENQLKISFEHVLIPNADEIVSHRVKQWTNKLVDSDEPGKQIDKHIEEVMNDLEKLSKEDLVKRLLAKELEQLKNKDGQDDINEAILSRDNDRGGNRKRSGRRGPRSSYKSGKPSKSSKSYKHSGKSSRSKKKRR